MEVSEDDSEAESCIGMRASVQIPETLLNSGDGVAHLDFQPPKVEMGSPEQLV